MTAIAGTTCPRLSNSQRAKPQVKAQESPAKSKRPQQDSNLRSRLRRPLLSPLSYGGCATPKGTSHKGRADTWR